MRLAVSCIPFDNGKSGISVYAREVVLALAAQGHELTLICEEDLSGLVPGAECFIRKGLRLAKIQKPEAPRKKANPVFSMVWHLTVLPLWLRKNRKRFDGFVICAANRRVCAWYPVPTVATVHDLANFHVPGKYSRMRMFYLAHVLPFFAKRAHHLVAVSGATKTDMMKFWGCRDEDVTVLYNGLTEAKDARAAHSAQGTASSAILYISRIEHPGKNHVRLIEAYGRLPAQTAAKHPLVLAGADWQDADVVHDAAAKSPNAAHIRFTGFVDDIEALWREAGFYVFPSLFEGFGLSLVEAMSRRIPCACSENGSLGEIAGDVAIVFDPHDTASIASALEKLLGEDEAARAARIERGLEHVKKFSWPDHAAGIVKLLCKSSVFGVGIDCETNADAVAAIQAAKNERGRLFAFVNAHCLNVAYKDAEYHDLLNNLFDKVWPDGTGVRMAGRRLGFAVPENVNGTDLFPLAAASGGLSFWFLGARPGVAEKAMEICKAKYPQSKFLGATHGYHKEWRDKVAQIVAANPDVLLVAFGVPQQEKWIAAHRDELKSIGCVMAVGGLLDFLSGRIARAPRWVRKLGMEWIWRLAMEPCRMFRRYVIGNGEFLLRVRRERNERMRRRK